MTRRIDYPYFWDEGGIPYDEFMLACAICSEGAITQAIVAKLGWSLFDGMSYEKIDDFVAGSRQPSAILRRGCR